MEKLLRKFMNKKNFIKALKSTKLHVHDHIYKEIRKVSQILIQTEKKHILKKNKGDTSNPKKHWENLK